MKKILLFLIIQIITLKVTAQTPDWQWVSQAGGTGWDELYDLVLDDSGNIYITGYFSETVIFGSDSLTSIGEQDIFVAKLDTNGNWEWTAQAGGIGWDGGNSIVIDNYGNSYVTGYFSETAIFSSDSLSSTGSSLTSVDAEDIFVAKLDADGNWEWATQAGGNEMDMSHGIAIDDSCNIFITGRYYDTITFGQFYLSNYGGENYCDAFVAKLNSIGDWLWVSHIGSVHDDMGSAITINETGDAIVTGNFEHHASFGPYTLHSQGSDDIYVAKISTNGNWEWVTQAGGEYHDFGNDITIDNSNIIHLTGGFYIEASFGSDTITSMGEMDVFISKLNSDGNWLSVSHAGGWEYDYGFAITTDALDNPYITGWFDETALFGQFPLMGNGSYEIYIAKLDSEGSWEWAISAGSCRGDVGYGIELDTSGNIYLAGRFMDVATFGSFILTSNGYSDIFVAKLDNPVSIDNELPKSEFTLSNYPNPFNPTTTISFETTNLHENARIDIYNLKGQKVNTLPINQLTNSPVNQVIWDGTDINDQPVSSGVYFYKLIADDKAIATKKCLLLK